MLSETRSSIELTVGMGFTAVLSLVYAAYAGRRLGPEQYADFAAAVALATLGATMAGPVNATVAAFAAEHPLPSMLGRIRAHSGQILRRALRYGTLALIGVALFAGPLTHVLEFRSPLVTLAALMLAYLSLLVAVPRGALRGMQAFGPYNVGIVFEATLRLVAGVILVELTRQAYAGVAAYSVALAATLLLSRFQLRRIWGGCDPEPPAARSVARAAIPFTLLTIATAGYQNADMLAAKHWLAADEAGHYGAVVTLVRVFSVLSMPFTTLMLPVMARLRAVGAPFLWPFLRVLGGFVALAAPPLAVCMFASGWIVAAAYGPEFGEAAAVLPWLATARVVGYITDLFALACVSSQQVWVLRIYVPGLVVQLAALSIWHTSAFALVWVILITEAATLCLMLAGVVAVRLRRRPQADSAQPNQE